MLPVCIIPLFVVGLGFIFRHYDATSLLQSQRRRKLCRRKSVVKICRQLRVEPCMRITGQQHRLVLFLGIVKHE